jgi:hypothetical protein
MNNYDEMNTRDFAGWLTLVDIKEHLCPKCAKRHSDSCESMGLETLKLMRQGEISTPAYLRSLPEGIVGQNFVLTCSICREKKVAFGKLIPGRVMTEVECPKSVLVGTV